MKYQIIASPIRGQKITKKVEGVRELHDYLSKCHEMGYSVTQVRRIRRPMVQLRHKPQLV